MSYAFATREQIARTPSLFADTVAGALNTHALYRVRNLPVGEGGGTQTQADYDLAVSILADAVFELDGANYFCCENLKINATNGHVFDQTGTLSHGHWRDLSIVQYSTSHSIYHLDDSAAPGLDYIDNEWSGVDTFHSESATVPTFLLKGFAVNRNRWINMRPTYSGNYTFWIEATNTESYAFDNTIEGITGEVLTGGAVKLVGALGSRIVDFSVYDLINATTKDLFVLEKTGVLWTRFTTLENVRRVGFSLGVGKYDLYVGGGGGNSPTILINCGGSTALSVRDGGRITQIDGSVTYSNGQYVTKMVNSVIAPARFATIERPAASTGAGSMICDITLNQPIWSDGTNWRDAAGTVV